MLARQTELLEYRYQGISPEVQLGGFCEVPRSSQSFPSTIKLFFQHYQDICVL
jgi:hypothetical protein